MSLHRTLSPSSAETIFRVLRETRGLLTEKNVEQLLAAPSASTFNQMNDQLGPKKDSDLARWYIDTFLAEITGMHNYLYLDSQGFISIGPGYRVLNGNKEEEIFAALQQMVKNGYVFMTTPMTSEKSDDQVVSKLSTPHTVRANDKDLQRAAKFLAAEHERVKKIGGFHRFPAHTYYNAQQNYLLLDELSTKQMAILDAQDKIQILKNCYPGFHAFPAGAQAALLDMSYHLEAYGLKVRFPNLNRMLITYEPDWLKIATETQIGNSYSFHRADVSHERNAVTHVLFLLAAEHQQSQVLV